MRCPMPGVGNMTMWGFSAMVDLRKQWYKLEHAIGWHKLDYFKEIDTHVSDYPELQRGCRVMLSQSKKACWQELVEMYTGMKRFGPPPVASTFNTLLNGMLLLGDLKHAIFIVEEMYRNHFMPCFTSLSKTLKMAVKVGNLLDGLLVFELMLRPAQNGKIGDACELFLDIFSNGTADVAVYNIYFQCLCQENKSREALSQLKRMMKVGFKPNKLEFQILLSLVVRKEAPAKNKILVAKKGSVTVAKTKKADSSSDSSDDDGSESAVKTKVAVVKNGSAPVNKGKSSSSLDSSDKDSSLDEDEIFEKNPTKIKNYGIWLCYQSRTGYHNMYKEYRDTILNGAVEQKYTKIVSRHRVRFPCIQIIKTATIPAKLCKRDSTKQLHNSKIKFPLVFNKVRLPTRKLKTTYKASKPNLFKFSHCNEKRVNVVYGSKIFGSEHLLVC
ncbi:hypothetical protein GOBAR_AA05172 [Gossypium barbadense]|uniref:Large ribosomal subunit protein eL20 domain-containing protein n=1 Tax=Gossypium barbadense TaxID=3634 RepID=A0A2P5YIK8_GOSBA|nr:hypothetical protein GOBAR_AA05172 [Gossypium barbadense]